MTTQELRVEVSKIFIAWGMGTKQIAIIQIVNLIEKEVEERIVKRLKVKD